MTKKITVFLVQLSPELGAIVRQAMSSVCPTAKFIPVDSVKAALGMPAEGRQLIILGGLGEVEVTAAAQAMDKESLPRWAVIVLGGDAYELAESVPLKECNVTLLARVFHSAILQHELLRENLALRGDLKTIARRFSHDLRSPLNCMHLTCEVLKELATEGETTNPQIEVLRNSLAETFRIIERVSYVVRASMEPQPPTTLPMNQVINRVLQQLEEEPGYAGATVRQPVKWPEVNGVAAWLEVIWKNLIVNALKHSPPTAPIQLDWSQQSNAFRFWVANQGEPLGDQLQAQLFQRFEQLHTLPAPGIGLPIVQRLVSLQGGHCSYERRKDNFSVFAFTLPQ